MVLRSFFIFSDHHIHCLGGCTKLKIDLDAKARHDAGLDVRPGSEQCAEGFSRWTDDLKIRSHMKPGENFNVVKQLRSLLVIETQSSPKAFRNVAAEFEVIIADAKLIFLTRRNDSLAAKTEAIELLKRARLRIRYPGSEKDPKALRSI